MLITRYCYYHHYYYYYLLYQRPLEEFFANFFSWIYDLYFKIRKANQTSRLIQIINANGFQDPRVWMYGKKFLSLLERITRKISWVMPFLYIHALIRREARAKFVARVTPFCTASAKIGSRQILNIYGEIWKYNSIASNF